MIAYDELSAALERWRVRNGLLATPPLFADGRGAAPPLRATPAIAAAPPLAQAAPAPHREPPPPPPSARQTVMGMAAPVPVPAPPAAMELVPPPPDDDGADLGEADVVEEADPYDNQGSDFAVGFASDPSEGEATRAGGGPTTQAEWPEANTVSTYGWGQAAPARPEPVDDLDEATHIGDPTRHDS